MTPDQYNTDERLDAGLEKMLGGFAKVPMAPSESRLVKHVALHGYKVEIIDEHAFDAVHAIRVYMPAAPTVESEYAWPASCGQVSFFYDTDTDTDADKPAAYADALVWADRMAFGYFAMEMALYATTTEPHYVAGDTECEPWHGLATHIVCNLQGEEGMYVADVSADLSSHECGPCVGGQITIPLSSDKDDPREIAIRCELVWSMRVADRLLAVYEFSRC